MKTSPVCLVILQLGQMVHDVYPAACLNVWLFLSDASASVQYLVRMFHNITMKHHIPIRNTLLSIIYSPMGITISHL